MANISAWKTVVYLPREKLSLLPTDCPKSPAPVSFLTLDPSVSHEPLDYRRSMSFFGPVFPGQHGNPIFGFKIECRPHNIGPHLWILLRFFLALAV
jgi:hypothetical protein